jgi:hypothetical protein
LPLNPLITAPQEEIPIVERQLFVYLLQDFVSIYLKTSAAFLGFEKEEP